MWEISVRGGAGITWSPPFIKYLAVHSQCSTVSHCFPPIRPTMKEIEKSVSDSACLGENLLKQAEHSDGNFIGIFQSNRIRMLNSILEMGKDYLIFKSTEYFLGTADRITFVMWIDTCIKWIVSKSPLPLFIFAKDNLTVQVFLCSNVSGLYTCYTKWENISSGLILRCWFFWYTELHQKIVFLLKKTKCR